jgi:hypothetical protein
MFGMIYGALLCEKAGVSMDAYVEQLPLTIKVVHDYYDVFAASVPSGNFSNPPASLATYYAAFQDTLNTCRDLGTPQELPQLFHDLVKRGIGSQFPLYGRTQRRLRLRVKPTKSAVRSVSGGKLSVLATWPARGRLATRRPRQRPLA